MTDSREKPTCALQTTSEKRRDEEGARAMPGHHARITAAAAIDALTHRTIRGIVPHSILASESKYGPMEWTIANHLIISHFRQRRRHKKWPIPSAVRVSAGPMTLAVALPNDATSNKI